MSGCTRLDLIVCTFIYTLKCPNQPKSAQITQNRLMSQKVTIFDNFLPYFGVFSCICPYFRGVQHYLKQPSVSSHKTGENCHFSTLQPLLKYR